MIVPRMKYSIVDLECKFYYKKKSIHHLLYYVFIHIIQIYPQLAPFQRFLLQFFIILLSKHLSTAFVLLFRSLLPIKTYSVLLLKKQSKKQHRNQERLLLVSSDEISLQNCPLQTMYLYFKHFFYNFYTNTNTRLSYKQKKFLIFSLKISINVQKKVI